MSSKWNWICATMHWWHDMVKATEVTAGVAEVMAAYRQVDGLKSTAG